MKPSGSNRLLLCPLDVLNLLYCHQSVPCALVTLCHVARLRVDLRGVCLFVCLFVCVRVCVCVCVCCRPVLVVASALTVAIPIKNGSNSPQTKSYIIPRFSSLNSKPSRHTLSNAFEISRKTLRTSWEFLSSKEECIKSTRYTN